MLLTCGILRFGIPQHIIRTAYAVLDHKHCVTSVIGTFPGSECAGCLLRQSRALRSVIQGIHHANISRAVHTHAERSANLSISSQHMYMYLHVRVAVQLYIAILCLNFSLVPSPEPVLMSSPVMRHLNHEILAIRKLRSCEHQ